MKKEVNKNAPGVKDELPRNGYDRTDGYFQAAVC
jgi:hypothetical protein